MFTENPAEIEIQKTIAEISIFRLKTNNANSTRSTAAINVQVPKKAPIAHNKGAVIIKRT
jgi:hypothetical protein